MANNFKFLTDNVSNGIQVKLYGDFDGSSACEIINFLQTCKSFPNQISIDTNNIGILHPFGLKVFKMNLGTLDVKRKNISITGKHRFSF